MVFSNILKRLSIAILFFAFAFNGFGQATHLGFYAFPAKGNINSNLPSFEVQALTVSGTVDTTFHGLITLAKVSGTGSLGGIDTATAVKGNAIFGHVLFSASGTYVVSASSPGLTTANSSSVVISGTTVFGTPSKLIYFWDFNQTLPYEGTGQTTHPADSLGTAITPLLPDYTSNGQSAQIRYYRPNTKQTSAVRLDSTLTNAQNGSFLYEYNNSDYRYFINPDSLLPGGNMCIRANNPSLNSSFYLTMPTKGYQNINLNFALTGSGSTMANFLLFSYSSDGGKTWSGLSSAMDTFKIAGVHYPDSMLAQTSSTTSGKWIPVSLNFSSGQLISDNPNFILRFQLAGTANHNVVGYTQFDNFALTGDSICPTFSVNASNVNVCPLGRVVVSAQVVGGVENTYQWQEDAGSGFVNLTDGGFYSGTKTLNLVLTTVPANMSGRHYRLLVSSGLCKGLTSNSVLLTVRTLPSVTANALHPIACYGDTNQLLGGGAQTYVWSGGLYLDRIPFNTVSSGTYTVTGTDAYGCVNTASTTITMNPLPKVTASSDAVKNQVCLGSSLTLSGGGASSYIWTYQPTAPTGLSNPLNGVSFIPNSTQRYLVTGTDNNGCKDTASIVIKIDSLPHVTALATNSSVCVGNKIALRGSGNAITYTWSGGISNDVAFTPQIGKMTYTVTGSDSNNCKSTATIAITTFTPPTVLANSSKSVVCAGSSLILYGTGAKSYQWSDGVIDSLSFIPTAAKTYTVTGLDSNGCSASATVSVGYNQLPVVVANATSTEICQGTTTLLYGTGAVKYTWTGNITDSIAFTPIATQTYTLTGTDINGCMGHDSITVLVDSVPNFNIKSSYTTCDGKAIAIGGLTNSNNNYQWSPSSGLSCVDCANPTLTVNGNNTYTVTATGNASGCATTKTVAITANPLPPVTATASSNKICVGDNETLTGGGATKYSWTGGVINKVPFTPSITTTYTVTGTDSHTCSATSTVLVTVNQLPLVTASTTAFNVCSGQTVKLTGGGALTYVWSPLVNNDSAFVLTNTQTFTVTGTDSNSCSSTATVTVTLSNCTGLQTINNSEVQINIYPNPSSGIATIQGIQATDIVTVYSLLGGKIISYIGSELINSFSNQLNLAAFGDGVYFIEVYNTVNNRNSVQKLMLHHQ